MSRRKIPPPKRHFSKNGRKYRRQARELHDGLEIKSNFTTWFDRMCEYGFTENDYTVMWSDSKNGNAVEFEKMRITYWLLKKE
ncbi:MULTISPECIES: antA/AntB antirepressor family protein [Enterocloster]|uniref:antA/AntB antirepressor family protein n=1 Tax=Clostridia TaxID=186801 RepID=UPI002FE52844